MNVYGRSSRWAAALALGLLGLIGVSAATVHAAPARTSASAFELTLEARWYDPWVFSPQAATFRSRAPFCATGTFVEDAYGDRRQWRFTCDDGTGSLTVSVSRYNTAWRIVGGSGSYAGFHGRGSLQGEVLACESCDPELGFPWRGNLRGVVDRDSVAPTIAISKATATKLPRRARAYAIRVSVALRDDVEENSVSYTLRAYAGGDELARRFGSARTKAVSMTLRIRPPAGARTVRLTLTASDPVGNAKWVRHALRLPR